MYNADEEDGCNRMSRGVSLELQGTIVVSVLNDL